MSSWSIYDLATGRVERSLSYCTPDMVALQYDPASQGCVEGFVNDETHRIVDGAPVSLPPKSSAVQVFDWALGAWVDPRTLDQMRADKLREINQIFTVHSAELIAGYPAAERQTWAAQEVEALAWAADHDTPTPYLDGIAAARGIDPADMRAKTFEAVNTFRVASQWLVGTRQALRDAIQHPDATREQIAAVAWPIFQE